MKKEGIIKAERRSETTSGANRRLRDNGYLPGSIFGKGMEAIPVVVKRDELIKALHQFGKTAVFKIDLDGEKSYNVMIREIQNLPTKGGAQHVDFQKITLTEETKADIPIKLIGTEFVEAKRLYLLHQMDAIPVRGLPRSMPEEIVIDISGFEAGDNVTIGKIVFPEGIHCDVDLEHVIISVKESKQTDAVEGEEVEEVAEEETE